MYSILLQCDKIKSTMCRSMPECLKCLPIYMYIYMSTVKTILL